MLAAFSSYIVRVISTMLSLVQIEKEREIDRDK